MKHRSPEGTSSKIQKTSEIEDKRREQRDRGQSAIDWANRRFEGNPASWDGQHVVVHNAKKTTTTYIPAWKRSPTGESLKERIEKALEEAPKKNTETT